MDTQDIWLDRWKKIVFPFTQHWLIVYVFSLSGVSSLISLLACAQGDDYIRLNVMLCEAVVAVYLSLLIHGLGTHSGNELFRLAAHPLNNRMWAAVFGGGAKLIVKPKRPPEITPGESSALPEKFVDVAICQICKESHNMYLTHSLCQKFSSILKNM